MLSGISIWQLLIVLAIIVLIFGTKKLRNMGSDVGGAVKGFKSAMKEGEEAQSKNIEQKTTASAEPSAEKDKENS